MQAWNARLGHSLYTPADPIDTLADDDKVALLQQIDEQTRRIDARVKKVNAGLSGVHEIMLVVGSDGTFSADVRPLVRLNVSVIVEENGRREQGYGAVEDGLLSIISPPMTVQWSTPTKPSLRRCSTSRRAMPRPDR